MIANRHEQAIGLTLAVGQRVNTAHAEANRRLVQLGREEVPSLRGAVQAVLMQMRRQGTPPQQGERRLMESAGIPWTWAVFVTTIVMASAAWNFGAFTGLALGAFAGILSLLLIPSYPWILLPDRLHIPARKGALAHDLLPGSIGSMTIQGDAVIAQAAGEALVLKTAEPRKLISLLCLLKSPSLSGLNSPASWSVVLDAIDEETKERGRALVSTDGVLFVPSSRLNLLLTALTDERLPGELSLDEVLQLLSQVPTERWPGLAEHLGVAADARWFRKGGTVVEQSDNSSLGIVIRSGGFRVRIVSAETVQARALLEGLSLPEPSLSG